MLPLLFCRKERDGQRSEEKEKKQGRFNWESRVITEEGEKKKKGMPLFHHPHQTAVAWSEEKRQGGGAVFGRDDAGQRRVPMYLYQVTSIAVLTLFMNFRSSGQYLI